MPGSVEGRLSDQELEYYSRQIVLPPIGYEGQLRLRSSGVCIVGLGGLGSVAATQLAAMGVGHLRLVDYDVAELSNLQRQHLYDVDSVGYPKVEIAARRLHGLNPHVQIEPLPLAIGAHNAEDLIRGMDVVVDGLDHMAPRYAINRACVRLGVPYVFAAAVSVYGNISTILPKRTACLECFYGSIGDENLASCSILGVHPSVISLVASIEVAEAIRVLLGQEPRLAGKLLYCDIAALEFERVEASRIPDCPVCGSEPRRPPIMSGHRLVSELCSREGRRTFAIRPLDDLALDMEQLRELLRQRGFNITVKANLGTTFQWGSTGQASVLASGVMIVEGARTEMEAYDLFHTLVVEGLSVALADEDRRQEPSQKQGQEPG
jgi:molybdopterin/thiamine biosynthesis adenylyltransferase